MNLEKFLRNPYRIFNIMSTKKLLDFLPDDQFLKLIYRANIGKKLDLKNPKTFNEKLQWLKLYNRKPEYTQMVDKYEVREYVKQTIGEEYLIPLLGVWDNFEDIDFDKLPDQFVLKCTHDSGGLVVCRDKSKLDTQKAKEKINKSLLRNYYWSGREWPYKDVKPRIIAEKYMEDNKTKELRDYKFFGFDGDVKLMFIGSERQSGEEVKFDFYDSDFNKLNLKQGHPNSSKTLEKVETFEKMKTLASKLSKGFPQVRIDFYDVNGKIYFGEVTFFHFSGLTPFEPEEYDLTFGSWIDLDKV